jgi:hypothetical protein
MTRKPKPESTSTAQNLGQLERLLLLCIATGTDSQKFGITEVTVADIDRTQSDRARFRRAPLAHRRRPRG